MQNKKTTVVQILLKNIGERLNSVRFSNTNNEQINMTKSRNDNKIATNKTDNLSSFGV